MYNYWYVRQDEGSQRGGQGAEFQGGVRQKCACLQRGGSFWNLKLARP